MAGNTAGKVYLLLLVTRLFAVSPASQPFFKVDPIEFAQTDFRVATGVLDIEFRLTIIDPCELSDEVKQKYSSRTLINGTLDEFIAHCKKMKEKIYDPAFDSLVREFKEHGHNLNRQKRMVEPVTIVTLGTITVAGFMAIGNLIWTAITSSEVNDLSATVGSLKERDELAQKNGHLFAGFMNDTMKDLSELRRKVRQQAFAAIEHSFHAIDLYNHFSNLERVFEAIGDGYRSGKVPLREIAKISNMAWLKNHDMELARWLTSHASKNIDEDYLRLKFSLTITSADTMVFKVLPFKVAWNTIKAEDEPAEPVRYDGPEFIIHNSTANCTRSITVPNFHKLIYETCDQINYQERSLQMWQPTEAEPETSFEIRIVNNAYQLNCHKHVITIAGKDYTCAYHPIQIKPGFEFTVRNRTYSNRQIRSNVSSTLTLQDSFKPKIFNDSLEMDKEFWPHNEKMREVILNLDEWGKKEYPAATSSWSFGSWGLLDQTSILWIVTGVIASLLMLAVFCVCIAKQSTQGTGGSSVAAGPTSSNATTNINFNCSMVGYKKPDLGFRANSPSSIDQPMGPVLHPDVRGYIQNAATNRAISDQQDRDLAEILPAPVESAYWDPDAD